MNKHAEHARNAVISRGKQTDFAAMSRTAYGEWVDSLPQDEFMALIGLNDEFMREGRIRPASAVVDIAAKPNDDAWIVYTGEGDMPLPADQRCWVLFADGEAGPNRADAFLWGGDGSAKILAYQAAAQ
jgi:hypothetical protein